MKAVVVYESMYGNTHLVAAAIGAGLRAGATDAVTVLPVHDADAAALVDADLVVVGGPTHVHGMSRESTRHAAADAAQKPASTFTLEPGAEGDGLREWFDSLDRIAPNAAAFDTRLPGRPLFTGQASKGIAKRLRSHGCRLVVDPKSFFVTKENHLANDEEAHARDWGARLAAAMSSAQSQ
jgi:hypothetical protein